MGIFILNVSCEAIPYAGIHLHHSHFPTPEITMETLTIQCLHQQEGLISIQLYAF